MSSTVDPAGKKVLKLSVSENAAFKQPAVFLFKLPILLPDYGSTISNVSF